MKKNKTIYLKICLKNNKLTLKSQKRFKSEKHNVFTEECTNMTLSTNDNIRI